MVRLEKYRKSLIAGYWLLFWFGFTLLCGSSVILIGLGFVLEGMGRKDLPVSQLESSIAI